jgi:hypothetical protein
MKHKCSPFDRDVWVFFLVFEFHCDGNWRRYGEVMEEKLLLKENKVL